VQSSGKIMIANEDGIIQFEAYSLYDTIVVGHIGFETKSKPITELKQQNDTVEVFLKPYFSLLPPVNIEPPNPDKILETAFLKFIDIYQSDICSKINFRGTLQVNNTYKQWVEAAGEGMFFYKHTNTEVPQKLLFEKVFETGKSAGIEIKGDLGFSGITVPNHTLAILPWHLQNYTKSVQYSKLNNNSGSDIIQITLTPTKNATKALRKLDKYFGYLGYNSPALFENVTRKYCLNLDDTAFVSIELISDTQQKASFDRNKRIYSYRRYYFSFKGGDGGHSMQNVFSTLRYTLPRQPEILTYQTEMTFTNACGCPQNEDEYANRYGILAKGIDRNQWTWDQQRMFVNYDADYFGLKMRVNAGKLHSSTNLTPFIYREKALRDLKEAKGIELFRD
jgi:hypothetical protein